ncbi:MAG: M64 family metallopeptidase [Bacteroidales bacterium]|jgi:hypothetical protein|nr:M64 family metallopeptidase [Bacteroidales bacterium]
MKRTILLLGIALSFSANAQTDFGSWFTDKSLRIDYYLAGNHENVKVYPIGMREEPYWAATTTKLVDPFNYGNFKYELFNPETGELLFSRGYCTLFQEWQTTAEAKVTERSFFESARVPFPVREVKFVLSKRERSGLFTPVFETLIDPDDYFITREKPVDVKVTLIAGSGNYRQNVDFAFIAEGYTATEMEKFRSDVKKMAEVLFAEAPYDRYRDRFNIWAVEAVSQQSGTDVPGENIYVNTALNASFYTFDLDRYLTTQDLRPVYDYAGAAPYDNIIVLINSTRYGGGGVYNYYSGTTVDHPLSPKVFIHELGHGFAGLGDEYYSSDVAYEEFYPLAVEPWEPNITTLVNFEAKWKKLIAPGTPVPTPNSAEYRGITGLFEGGGYMAKGIYRPAYDCRMKSNGPDGFCEVCRAAIAAMIEFYLQ